MMIWVRNSLLQMLLTWSFYIGLSGWIIGQEVSIQERLGYSKDDILLILHADDLGVSHSENSASLRAMEKGLIRSASAMVPCPWFPEIAAYARSNPDHDIGLHLTLSSEWNVYKWRPVSPLDKVPSLVDSMGFFHPGWGGLPDHVKAEEVDIEVRAQIERAAAFGLEPTHLDPHMFLLFRRPDLLKTYLDVGREYGLPVLLNRDMLLDNYQIDVNDYLEEGDVMVDNIIGAYAENYEDGMEDFYSRVLHNLKPGLHYLFIHPAYDNPEMRAVTKGHKYWGSQWRQKDYDFFTNPDTRSMIEALGITLITWREIKEKLYDTSASR